MGWCSGTDVFDAIVGFLLKDKKALRSKEDVITFLIRTLEDMDWDCQSDSDYYGHPVIEKIFKELHPDWFEEK